MNYLKSSASPNFLGHLKPSKTLFLVLKNQVFGGENLGFDGFGCSKLSSVKNTTLNQNRSKPVPGMTNPFAQLYKKML